MHQKGTLIFFCGKMGAGKSTLSRKICQQTGAILLSEDEWLAAFYADEITDFDSYLKYSSRIKPLLKCHVQSILNTGVSVVMDFPANTQNQRQWFKDIYAEHEIPHRLVYIEASDQLCLKHIKQRRIENPQRETFDTEKVFHQVNSYFQPPCAEEGFNIEVIRSEKQ